MQSILVLIGCYFGYPDKELQVHNCWLFFPFHRWYLYFFERILGKLINDPTFGLPYWNWDNPSGMSMPGFFEGKTLPSNDPAISPPLNPAFDAFRNVDHLPPAILDIDYNNTASADFTCVQQIGSNLSLMYKQMITNSPNSETFFGGKFIAGDDPISIQNSKGPMESGVHTAAHIWVGNPRMPNNEDMGNFYSLGWDPLFYTHHANVDRMWKIWKDLKGPDYPDHTEPTDPDWLNASYVFYDENKELVRVYNKDCVQMEKFVKFDVFVNDLDDGTPCSPQDSEFAGSFSQVAHLRGHKMLMTSGVKFGLNELLDDIETEADEYILLTLVPRDGCQEVTIGEIKIELVPSSANSG
ncbi:Polyphenol oxidase, central domain-containing protein [Cynara cardunculus var. scolymus]|uniref:Polyphenol oxidase, central domain-containing protein n=1 Tax=Cynara cardunculus var. scolymus TaxID=59895 RepID=A0A103MFI0_CYNCS|nr:Polyphenol oxidase, central domain-containing protein [Cynara cardunculus var. scolymus]